MILFPAMYVHIYIPQCWQLIYLLILSNYFPNVFIFALFISTQSVYTLPVSQAFATM